MRVARIGRGLTAIAAAAALSACAGVVVPNEAPLADLQQPLAALAELPAAPGDPLVVGVYRFVDQSGQRRVDGRGPVAELSSALPQGVSAMLVQELARAGDGTYYRVVEREIVEELLNERNIVNATLTQTGFNALPPLLLPGIVFTGGAVSYDHKTVQGMAGASFASIGGTGQVYSDEVGVILRAVSVSTGEVLATVHARKSVFSASLGGSALRILGTDVLALEAGFATNEPVSLATRLAIAKAVQEMTELGLVRGWWSGGPRANTPGS